TTAPSSTATSLASGATSVSARSTTTRGGPASFSVVNESGRSPISSIDEAAASPPARTSSSRARSCANAATGRKSSVKGILRTCRNANTRSGGAPNFLADARAALADGVLHQIAHVLADLVDVVAHRQLDVVVLADRAPDEVLAARRVVDAARAVA